jgi:HSP20 family protein
VYPGFIKGWACSTQARANVTMMDFKEQNICYCILPRLAKIAKGSRLSPGKFALAQSSLRNFRLKPQIAIIRKTMKTNQIPRWVWVVFTALFVVIMIQGWFIFENRLNAKEDKFASAVREGSDDGQKNSPPDHHKQYDPWFTPDLYADIFGNNGDRDPFKEMEDMRTRMDKMMKQARSGFDNDDFFGGFPDIDPGFKPKVEVKENDKAYEVTVFVSDDDEANVKTELKDDRLIISSSTETEKSSKDEEYKHYRHTYSKGNFEQVIPFEELIDVSSMKSDYKDGKLTIKIHKKK